MTWIVLWICLWSEMLFLFFSLTSVSLEIWLLNNESLSSFTSHLPLEDIISRVLMCIDSRVSFFVYSKRHICAIRSSLFSIASSSVLFFNERIQSMYTCIFDNGGGGSSFALVLVYRHERERSSRKDLITYQGEYWLTNFLSSLSSSLHFKTKTNSIFKLIFSFIYLFIDQFNRRRKTICMCQ